MNIQITFGVAGNSSWNKIVAKRTAVITRETRETKVAVELNIDGRGISEIETGIGMLNHLLEQLARHGRFDIKITAQGDLKVNEHHTVEDVAISLGKAFNEALGEKKGIIRMGHAIVPMDDALALVAVDIGGRSYADVKASFTKEYIGELPTGLISHFLRSFAIEARLDLHARLLSGDDDHHKAEAIFKALARALDNASKIDDRISGEIPSTKGVIESA
jgi:imidazoleglycerol-phosphate dehydratase